MQLYDKIIQECSTLFEKFNPKKLDLSGNAVPDAGEHNLILRSDMAYELGGGTQPAIGGVAYTSSTELVRQNEIYVLGPDLPELGKQAEEAEKKSGMKGNIPYARIVFFRIDEADLKDDSKAYALMRKIEYTRYHMHPEGFMMRISAAENQEVVRVSREALTAGDGLDFAGVGRRFFEEYAKIPEILSAKMIFITEENFPYQKLAGFMGQAERITDSLNHIFQNLKMDCSVCGLKPVCDEVDGMKELHQQRTNSNLAK